MRWLACTLILTLVAGCASRYAPGARNQAVGLAMERTRAAAMPSPDPGPPVPGEQIHDTERYDRIDENDFLDATQRPLSTFAVDVDRASYANVRRFLRQGVRPAADVVRIEELINYFGYAYAPPVDDELPFAVHLETASCPWQPAHRLVRIGLKARQPELQRPRANLVFLLDVSGSMASANKLPLLKSALKLMVGQLGENDMVSIVVYAGAAGTVLAPTSGDQRERILGAFEELRAGGSTNGGAGIQLAYRLAREGFIPGAINRVMLATDGDFNLGQTSDGELTRMIEEEAKSGVFLTVLGLGSGNLNDAMLEAISNRGNGTYAYLDSLEEAHRVLVEQIDSTLYTVAKDVKVQVEFNPRTVTSYRLIGYENRLMAAEDFNDDQKDGGELGAGHTVTALYEIVPAGAPSAADVDPLRYQEPGDLTDIAESAELLTVKLRFKQPDGNQSKLLQMHLVDGGGAWSDASGDFQHAAAVAAFGMLLRDSKHKGSADFDLVGELAENGLGEDPTGLRREFLELVQAARKL